MTFLDRLNLPKLDFPQNCSGGKIIKFQQSQALTSHFESFWSIVVCTSDVPITFWWILPEMVKMELDDENKMSSHFLLLIRNYRWSTGWKFQKKCNIFASYQKKLYHLPKYPDKNKIPMKNCTTTKYFVDGVKFTVI